VNRALAVVIITILKWHRRNKRTTAGMGVHIKFERLRQVEAGIPPSCRPGARQGAAVDVQCGSREARWRPVPSSTRIRAMSHRMTRDHFPRPSDDPLSRQTRSRDSKGQQMNHVQAGSYLAGDASLSIDTQFSGAKGMMSGEGPVELQRARSVQAHSGGSNHT
jgi:hypothetical protein